MFKVYVVTEGEYDDLWIVGVFSEHPGDKFKNLDHPNVIEFNLDELSGVVPGFRPYQVEMVKETGKVLLVTVTSMMQFQQERGLPYEVSNEIWINVLARDEETAVKIADGIRKEVLAGVRQ